MISASMAPSIELFSLPELALGSVLAAPEAAEDSRFLVSYSFTLKLYEIVGHILSAFYEGDSSSQPDRDLGDATSEKRSMFNAPSMVKKIETGDLRDLVKYEASLDSWETALPLYLRFHLRGTSSGHSIQLEPQERGIATIFERQAVFLRARYEILDIHKRATSKS